MDEKDFKHISLKGFPEISWDSVFRRLIIESECGELKMSRMERWKFHLKLLFYAFFPPTTYKREVTHSPILFFISFHHRKSIVNDFLRVRGLTKSDLIEGEKNKRQWIPSIAKGCRFIFSLLPSWRKTLKRCHTTKEERIWAYLYLMGTYQAYRAIKDLDVSNYRLLVTYYDSIFAEAFVTKYLQGKGIKAATLQHGMFSNWTENVFINSGVEFKTFKSDYFLCWNKFTWDEAIKSGIDKEKLVVAGIWSYVNTKRQICVKPRNNAFGVVIGHPQIREQNEFLVRAANMLSETFHLKYYLKLHPNYQEDFFKDQVNENCLGIVKKGIPLIDYANMVDFSLVSSSSVFVELAYIEHDLYRYSSGGPDDKFKSVTVGKYFTNLPSLKELYEKEAGENRSKELFDYLCTVDDVTAAYKSFFSQFENQQQDTH